MLKHPFLGCVSNSLLDEKSLVGFQGPLVFLNKFLRGERIQICYICYSLVNF